MTPNLRVASSRTQVSARTLARSILTVLPSAITAITKDAPDIPIAHHAGSMLASLSLGSS